LPKKRRRVLPVEQPRRKRDIGVSNRRIAAMKHQQTSHQALFKDAFGCAKIGWCHYCVCLKAFKRKAFKGKIRC
jgi:hypothetical protein